MEDVILTLLKALAFIVVLFIALFLYKRFYLSGKHITRRNIYIDSLDKYYLASDKWVQIVRVGQRLFILGVTPNNISKIEEIAQEDLHEIKAEYDDNFFSSILSKYAKNEDSK